MWKEAIQREHNKDESSYFLYLNGILLVLFGSAVIMDGFYSTITDLRTRRLERQRQVAENVVHKLIQRMQQEPPTSISIDIHESQDLIEILPNEIWCSIFDYLSMRDLNQASLVCKKWYNLTSHPIVWRKFALLKGVPDKYQGKQSYVIYLSDIKITQTNKQIVWMVNESSHVWHTFSAEFHEKP